MERRLNAIWSRNGKTLNLIIGTITIPITDAEASELRDLLDISMTTPSEKRVHLKDARGKLGLSQ